MGGMGQHFGPFSVVIAATTNVGVLEGGGVFGTFQEGAVPICSKGGRSSGSNGSRWPSVKTWVGADGDAALAGRIDTRRAIGFDQRQHTQTGAEALLGVRRIGQGSSGALPRRTAVSHHHLAKGACSTRPAGAGLPRLTPPKRRTGGCAGVPRCRRRVFDRDIQRCANPRRGRAGRMAVP